MKIVFLVAVLTLTGCATTNQSHYPSYLDSSLGSNMDSTDHVKANEVLESGSEERPISWVNPVNKKRFTVTPLKTFKYGDKDCRTYSATYGGRTETGSACRKDDGTWMSR